jgi:hypothetical protein
MGANDEWEMENMYPVLLVFDHANHISSFQVLRWIRIQMRGGLNRKMWTGRV